MDNNTLIITEEGERLDKAISKLDSEISRASIQRMIQAGKILVNGKVQKPSYIVKLNDEINIEKEKPKEANIEAENIPIEIVYEDNDIIVVNKPKGLVVHPGNGNQNGTLVNALLAICKNSLSGIGGKIRPGIVHRLDKDTSRINYYCKK